MRLYTTARLATICAGLTACENPPGSIAHLGGVDPVPIPHDPLPTDPIPDPIPIPDPVPDHCAFTRVDLQGKAGVQSALTTVGTRVCDCPTVAVAGGSPIQISGQLDGFGPLFPGHSTEYRGMMAPAWIGQQQDCVTLHADRDPYSPSTAVWYVASTASGVLPRFDLAGADDADLVHVVTLDGIPGDLSDVMLTKLTHRPDLPAVLAVGSQGGGPIMRIEATLAPGAMPFRTVLDPLTLAEESARISKNDIRAPSREKLFTGGPNPIQRISGSTPAEFREAAKSVARLVLPSDQRVTFYTEPRPGVFEVFAGANGTVDRVMISSCTSTQIKPDGVAAALALVITAKHCISILDGGYADVENAEFLATDRGEKLDDFNAFLGVFRGTAIERRTIKKIAVRDTPKRLEDDYAQYNYVGANDTDALAASKGADGLIVGRFEGRRAAGFTTVATLEENDMDAMFIAPSARRAENVLYEGGGSGGGGGNDPVTSARRIIAMVGHPNGDPQSLSWVDPVTDASRDLPPSVDPKIDMGGLARQLERYDGSETLPRGLGRLDFNMFSTLPSLGGNSGGLWLYRMFGDQSVEANRPRATDDGKCPSACKWGAHAVHKGGLVSNTTTQPRTSWVRYPGRNFGSDVGSLYEPVVW